VLFDDFGGDDVFHRILPTLEKYRHFFEFAYSGGGRVLLFVCV
jgi:hypothetical protein